MSGGGESQSDPGGGFVANWGAPLLRAAGMGIAARGGALGPFFASIGDSIQQSQDDRIRRDVYANIMPGLLAGVTRSREIKPGTPGTPGVPGMPEVAPSPSEMAPRPEIFTLDEADVPDAEAVIAGSRGSPARPEIPAIPGKPPEVRTWQTDPMMSEVLARLQAQGAPETTRAIALREALRLRLPTSVETPPDVTDEIKRGQHLEDVGSARGWQVATEGRKTAEEIATEERHRQAAIAEQARKAPLASAVAPSGYNPTAYGQAVAAGITPPPLEKQTTVSFENGRQVTRDARTNEVISSTPIRTQDEEAAIVSLIPDFKRDFEAAIQTGAYRGPEVARGRWLLNRAQQTGKAHDVDAFMTFAKDVAAERSAERIAEIKKRNPAGATPTETVTTRDETIPTRPIWHKDEFKAVADRLDDVVRDAVPNFQAPKGPVTTPSGKKVSQAEYLAVAKKAIEERYREAHGVDVTVQWVPASGWNPMSGFSSGSWKVVRAREPERKKSSTTERRKGPPGLITVPAE